MSAKINVFQVITMKLGYLVRTDNNLKFRTLRLLIPAFQFVESNFNMHNNSKLTKSVTAVSNTNSYLTILCTLIINCATIVKMKVELLSLSDNWYSILASSQWSFKLVIFPLAFQISVDRFYLQIFIHNT